MQTTIYDISKKSGVSIATVSRVLNNKKGVSEKTRQKVLAVMEEIGYTPNAFARGLGLNTIKTVGIMCMDVSDIYLASAVSTLERELRHKGYDSLLCCTGANAEDKRSYLQVLLSKRVDAIILVGSHFISGGDSGYIIEAARQVPIILINGYIKGENIYCMLTDDFGLVRDAVSQLINGGHRRILYVYDTTTYSGRQKMDGYKTALTQAGIPIEEELILFCKKNLEESQEKIGQLLDQGVGFDAVVCAEDEQGVAAVKAAIERGIPIPERMEVIGYNNSILSRCSEPGLTSIDNRVEASCMTAINTLFGVFEGKDFPDRILISGELVKRSSTKI